MVVAAAAVGRSVAIHNTIICLLYTLPTYRAIKIVPFKINLMVNDLMTMKTNLTLLVQTKKKKRTHANKQKND